MTKVTQISEKKITPGTKFQFNASTDDANKRLDVFLTEQFEHYTRSYFNVLIENERVSINGKISKKSGIKLKENDLIEITFPEARSINPKELQENIKVKVLLDHEDFLIINKPAGLVVHEPLSGYSEPTLVDWLLLNYPELKDVGLSERPGIVHRLDKDTSGILVIPKHNAAHAKLSSLFKNRKIIKKYKAIVRGHTDPEGFIDLRITRHPQHKTRMMCSTTEGRESLTKYKVDQYFENTTLVDVQLVTGRTHQIRVHFRAIDHPLIGDTIYGEPSKLISRQALHAYHLEFDYNGEKILINSELPEDMQNLINNLKKIN